jgi:hypothetical protein
MTIENIFAPDPTFRQGQYHKLSDNVNDWDEQIHSILASVVPKRLGLKTMLHWQKVDDNQGYAVGSVVLSGDQDKSIGVPLIVKQWHLAPVDTLLIGDKAYPLSADTLKEVFTGDQLATEMIPRHGPSSVFDSGQMYQNTYPPVGGGRYVYSADESSLLEYALATAWEQDMEEFRKTAHDGEILAAAARSGNIDLFKLAARTRGKKPKKKKARRRSIMQVSKKGHNEYSILGNPEGVFDPVMHDVDRPTMRKFIGSLVGGGEAEREFVSRVDKNREQMIVGPKEQTGDKRDYKVGQPIGQHGEIFLYDTTEGLDSPSSCDKFGVYGVKDAAGVTSYGYVFPDVVNFDGRKMGVKLFVGKSCSTAQPRIVGTHEPDREVELPDTEPEPGKTGTLVYIEKGKALATAPFRVMSSMMHGCTKMLKVKDFYGKDTTLSFSPMAEGMTKIEKSKSLMSGDGGYVIPGKMRFVELATTKKLATSPNEHKKYASGHRDVNALKVMRSNDKFVFKAAGLDKYASVNGIEFDFNNLGMGQAKFLLASFGCPGQKIAMVLDRQPGLPVEIHGLTFPKLASEIEEDTSEAEFIRSLRCNLVKEASVMEEAEVVDTALSLGFINPENVAKYIQSIPKLKECVSLLSKLLLGSRLGMKNIPEEATTSAVQNILKVIDGLRRLGLMKHQQAA